jgi:hypothetical protein
MKPEVNPSLEPAAILYSPHYCHHPHIRALPLVLPTYIKPSLLNPHYCHQPHIRALPLVLTTSNKPSLLNPHTCHHLFWSPSLQSWFTLQSLISAVISSAILIKAITSWTNPRYFHHLLYNLPHFHHLHYNPLLPSLFTAITSLSISFLPSSSHLLNYLKVAETECRVNWAKRFFIILTLLLYIYDIYEYIPKMCSPDLFL